MGCFKHKGNFSQLPIKYNDDIVVVVGITPKADHIMYDKCGKLFFDTIEKFSEITESQSDSDSNY